MTDNHISQDFSDPKANIGTSQKLSLKSFGPGILMASAAIGGSHLVASTQA